MAWGTKRMKRRQNARKQAKADLAQYKKDMDPRKQYVGGSAGAVKKARATYDKNIKKGDQDARNAVKGMEQNYSSTAAQNDVYQNQFQSLAGQQQEQVNREKALTDKYEHQSDQAYRDYNNDRANYQGGRQGILDNAQKLERSADNMKADYIRTDDMRRAADQEASQRQALSAARSSGGGALAIRGALAAQSQANAAAAQQAGITRAQELNDMTQMQHQAWAGGASIRSGLAASDLNAAGQAIGTANNASQLSQGSRDRTLAGQAAIGSNIAADQSLTQQDYDNLNNALNAKASVGQTIAGRDTGAKSDLNSQQLAADSAYDQARREAAAQKYIDNKNKPGVLKKIIQKGITTFYDPFNFRGSEAGETFISRAL